MVSHVRVALSNIPSLLCWLLLLPSGTALSHLEVKLYLKWTYAHRVRRPAQH